MPNPPIPNQIQQEVILCTPNDDTKDWSTRVIESAETQYRAQYVKEKLIDMIEQIAENREGIK